MLRLGRDDYKVPNTDRHFQFNSQTNRVRILVKTLRRTAQVHIAKPHAE